MTRAEPQARVNIKYNHADSKVTYLSSLRRCHEYIFNESSIPSFEILVNLCEPMTSVSSLNSITLSLIYLGPLLKVLKYIYNVIFTKYLIFYYYCREYIVIGQNLMEFLVLWYFRFYFLNSIHQMFPQSSLLTSDYINRFSFFKQTLLLLSIYFRNRYYWLILIHCLPNLTYL